MFVHPADAEVIEIKRCATGEHGVSQRDDLIAIESDKKMAIASAAIW